MIAGNGKISARQMGRLAVLDWLGKAALLWPLLAGGTDGAGFFLGIAAGVILAMLYGVLIGWTARHIRGDFTAYAAERLGTTAARVMTFLYLAYAFVNTVFVARLFTEICRTFLLPGISEALLLAAILLTGAYNASGGLEVRARVSEILYPVVLAPLLILLLCAVGTAEPEHLAMGAPSLSLALAGKGLTGFLAFGGMGIFLYLAPFLSGRGQMGRVMARSILTVGGIVLALLAASVAAFGEAGMRALPWPVITLMSSAELPGGFIQRWDTVFTALLAASFLPAAGAGLYYLKTLTACLLGGRKKAAGGGIYPVLIWAAALWCGSLGTAMEVFTVIGGCICIPLTVIFTLLLAVVEHCGSRKAVGKESA